MEQKMIATDDHILEAFRNRDNPESLKNYVNAMQMRAQKQKELSKKGE